MLYVSENLNYIKSKISNVISLTLRSLLLSLTLIFLNACGGPPQNTEDNSEGPASIAVSPGSNLDFGEALTGFSYERTLTLYNRSRTVPATNINLDSSLSLPFSFTGGSYPGSGGTCGNELNAGATCTVVISLNPTSTGSISSTFQLGYENGVGTDTSSFTFTASARDPLPGTLVASPSGAHDFGIIAIGGFSEVNYTLSNTGELDSTGVSFSGLNAPFSIINNTCSATVTAGAQCSFTVRFDPAAQNLFNDTLNIDYNDGVAAQNLSRNFSGEGRVAGFLAIDEGLNFDMGLINGGANISQTLTVRNTGGGNATAISFGGITSPFSVTSNNCPGILAPGGSCSIAVRFAPSSTGDFNTAPTLSYSDGFNNQNTVVNFSGRGFANNLTLSLQAPASSPSNNDTPTIRVSNTITGQTIRLYSNSSCTIQVGNSVTTGTQIDFSPTMPEGTYEFHARAEDSQGNLSSCSASAVNYEYDNTAPNSPSNITLGSTFTTSPNSSTTINWTDSAGSPDVVDYQVGISTNPAGGNDVAGYTSKGDVNFATENGLTLAECTAYYVSVRAVDHVGLNSPHAVSAQSFRYDSAIPTTPSSLSESDDASDTNSATVSWNASSDNCGIDYYEVAVSEDTNGNNILESSEIGNVVAFTNIGNITTHRFDGLSGLTTGLNHYTSIRAVDTTGRTSGTAVSSPWIIYNPSIELPDMVLWLDSNDPATILDAQGDTADSGAAFSGVVDRWLDKSGSPNDHDFFVSSGANGPTYDGVNFSTVFDGANTGMTVNDHADLNNATVSQRNLTTAFRTSADINSRQVIYDEGGGIRGMNIYIFNGRIYCGFYNTPNDGDGSQAFTSVSTPVAANSTYYVTWVFDYTNYAGPAGPDGSLTCYVNDTVIGTTTSTTRLFSHSGNIGLGHVDNASCFEDGSCPSSDSHFDGQIYEVMIFNNVPDASDVTNVHTFLSNKWN